MSKKVKKPTTSIVSTKVTLNLKGKKITLSLEELRTLRYQINVVLDGYSYNVPSLNPFPSYRNNTCDLAAVDSTSVTHGEGITISGATLDTTLTVADFKGDNNE